MGKYKLNPQQQEAVDTVKGPLLLLAGAGTGKTRVIVQRIGHILELGIPAESVLAVTFTNKAAREMKERVAELADFRRGSEPTVCTFHSFCISVLRQHADLIGFRKNFTLATEGYQKGLLREICTELGLNNEGIDPYTWLSRISLAKANMETPADMSRQSFHDAPRIAAIYKRYQERLRRMEMMDFDDLLGMTIELWKKRPDCLEGYINRFKYLMIDEFQDTNRAQLEIMVMLAGKNQNICAVGDDDQSIYGWRGASQQNILDFEHFFPGAKIIRLEQNYRSSSMILDAANAVIANNKARRPKKLWSARGGGDKISCVQCEDEKQEAAFIADTVFDLSLKGSSLLDRNRDWRKFAILYRTSSQSRLIEEALRKRKIPFVIVGSKSFYQKKEILDIVTMLELVSSTENDMALQRIINVPPRGMGDAALDKLSDRTAVTRQPAFHIICNDDVFLNQLPPETRGNLKLFTDAILRCKNATREKTPLYPHVKQLLDDIQYVPKLIQMYKPRADALVRKENVMEFLNSVSDFDEENRGSATLADFLAQIALQDSGDKREKDKDVTENAVNLLTIHASKGLEFPVVFVAGMEQGLFPHAMALEEGNMEEERRLCYVAMTRAKDTLYLTYADKRKVMNLVTHKRISPFIMEIPDEFLNCGNCAKFRDNASEDESLDYISQILARIRQ